MAHVKEMMAEREVCYEFANEAQGAGKMRTCRGARGWADNPTGEACGQHGAGVRTPCGHADACGPADFG
eukprot:6212783-Pleurochrysis_carterae.AAC.3